MFLHLPVARSKEVRTLFVVTTLITVGVLFWMGELRVDSELRGLSPIFFYLFSYLDSYAAMGSLLILLLLLLAPARPAMARVLTWIAEHNLAVAAATTLVLCAGAVFVYQAHPLSMDEYAPTFQAKVFAAGHLTGHFPADLLDALIPKGFQNYFLNVSPSGAVISGYWPSFALLLTPFTWLGIPWACNPVLSGLTVVAMHRAALRLFGNLEAAGLVVLLTIASPVFFADGISYYSMTAHMLFNTVFMLLLLEQTARRLVAAGVIGSIALTLHNPLPHMLFAAPWLIWIALNPRGIAKLAWLAVGYLPLCLLLGVGWFLFSNGLVHEAANAASGVDQAAAGFAWPSATVLLARFIGLAKVWLWAVPGLVVLACMGAWKCRSDVRCRLLLASALITFCAYLFVVPDQGHGWGFRYFHSTWLALPLLGVAALFRTTETKEAATVSPARPDADMRGFVVTAALLTLVIGVGLRGYQMRDFISGHLRQVPAYAGTESRVLLVDPTVSFYGFDLIQNDPFLRGDVVRMLSGGPALNRKIVHELRPDFHRVYADPRGEVWSALGSER